MKRPVIVTGLDIGSAKVSGVTAELYQDRTFTVVAHHTSPARGLSRGTIVDLKETTRSVSEVLAVLREKFPKGPGQIFANITGPSVTGARSRGMVPISLRGREIIKPDIDRCIDVASTIHLPFDREIIHRIVQKFSIDEQTWIEDPQGLYASRLICEAYIITTSVNQIQNIYKCVAGAGYDISEVVYSGMANGEALLSESQKTEGTAILDIGASLTELSIFISGKLCEFEVILAGSADMREDFASDGPLLDAVRKIRARITDFERGGGAIDSVILTGGMALTDNFIEFLEQEISRPVSMGATKDLRGDLSASDSMRLTTAVGLVKYASNKYLRRRIEQKNIALRLSDKVVDIFNNYF